MQYLSRFIILALCCTFCIACKQNNSVRLHGELTGLETDTVYLSYLDADTLRIDTIATSEAGKFKWANPVDTLTMFTLFLNDNQSSIVIYANKNDKISLKGDATLPDLIRVTGNDINDELTAFKDKNEELLKQRGEMFKALGTTDASEGNFGANGKDESRLNSLNHELMLEAENHIKEHPTTLSSVILINDFFANNQNPESLERLLNYLDGDIVDSELVQTLKRHSEHINQSAEGRMLPYFEIEDTKEKKHLSYDYIGKYLVLSFVSSSGQSSRDQLDELKTAYKELNKDSVEFVSVYMDTDNYPIEYPETDSLPWTIVTDKRSWASHIVTSFNITEIPYSILVDPEGKIVGRNISAHQIIKKVGSDTIR